MVRSISLVFALLLLSTAGWAQDNSNSNSPEARACRGDARRFCGKELGDEFRVASCLMEHREKLTRACRAVLEGHGM
jgi:hypothetical protein